MRYLICFSLIVFCGSRLWAADWLFVIGSVTVGEQSEYENSMKQIASYYGKLGHRVSLKRESELGELPSNSWVSYAGPISAFKDISRLSLPIKISNNGLVTIGNTVLIEKDLGIYLRSKDSRRSLYTGNSLRGFDDVWKVPTGRHICTITKDRRLLYQGDYVDGKLQLVAQSFLPPLPKAKELNHLLGLGNAVHFEDGLKNDYLAPSFKKWLQDTLPGKKVLVLGENHWSQRSNFFFKTLTLELAKNHLLGTIFLEVPFSSSRIFNHYVKLSKDSDAQAFYPLLKKFLLYEDTLKLLDEVRHWNRTNPVKQVRIACHDLEWSKGVAAREIIVPFFKKLKPNFQLTNSDIQSPTAFKQALSRISPLFKRAHKEKLKGKWPFISATYVGQVLVNMKDTVLLERQRFNEMRQKAINRNLGNYHRKSLKRGLLLFKVGSYHASKELVEGQAVRDAAFLQHQCPVTKGKVVSLRLATIGYGFSPVAHVDWQKRKRGADQYFAFVNNFQKAVMNQRAKVNYHYMLNKPNLIDKLATLRSYQKGGNCFFVKEVNKSQVAKATGGDKSLWTKWDGQVIIVRSPIELTMRK